MQHWSRWGGMVVALALVAPAAHGQTFESGSGFVLTADGLIATCAHVLPVDGRIEVVIAGKSYVARLLAKSEARDVALLRVSAGSLTPLPLVPLDRVPLGEEVRAFGFPLRGSLGDSLKVTRGTISGLDGEAEERLIQTDVVVNRGNSGGPLVNHRGEVLGVVMAKLDEAGASGVAFAVPTDAVTRLVKEAGLRLPADLKAAESALSGPDLVKRVQASVARVTVRHDRTVAAPGSNKPGAPAVPPKPAASTPARPPVDPEVARQVEEHFKTVRAAEAPALPKPRMEQVDDSASDAVWNIQNDTEQILTVRFNGPDKRAFQIKPKAIEKVSLVPGDYEMSATLSKPGVDGKPAEETTTPYYGRFELRQGGRYRSRFYVVQ